VKKFPPSTLRPSPFDCAQGSQDAQALLCPHFQLSAIFLSLPYQMQPDYAHKVFNDKRMGYFLLMEALAMGCRL
jgi:hypothetical protein